MLKHDLCVRSMPVAMFLAMEYRVCMHVPRIIASGHNLGGPYDHIPPEHLGSPVVPFFYIEGGGASSL